MALVPLPPPPLVPVVKKPLVVPFRTSPLGFSPSTDQMIILFAGNGGEGIHVNTVSPALHAATIGSGVNGLLISRNCASVRSVSIASLNVNTTAADGDTPV